MNNSRIDWIDILKGINISFIVMGHIISDSSNIFQTWIYSFHVFCFFLINGILFRNKNVFDFLFINEVKKNIDVYVYYIIFSFIFFLRYLLQFFLGMVTISDLNIFLKNIFLLNGVGVLWFIPTFSISSMFFKFILKSNNALKVAYICLLIFSFFMLNTSFLPNNSNFVNLILIKLFLRCIIGTSIIFLGFFLSDLINASDLLLLIFSLPSLFSFYNGNVDLNILQFNNLFLYYLFGLSGSIFLIYISRKIRIFDIYIVRLLKMWGRHTLFIMGTHTIFLIIQISYFLLSKFTELELIRIFVSFILTMFVETVFIIFIEKNEHVIPGWLKK